MNRPRWWVCTNLFVDREIARTSPDDEAIAALLAWVTDGSVACERLLTAADFVVATPPLDPVEARAVYTEVSDGDIQDLPTWLLARSGSK